MQRKGDENYKMKVERQAHHVKDYDIIVAGGGVAGVAAAVSAKRMGKSVLLIEKTIGLGGLATSGLINLFVPLCNGRGVQIIRGMAEEMLRLAVRYGYDTIPESWRKGEPEKGELQRYTTRFSAPIFTLALTEFVTGSGADILFDTVITAPVMEGNICKGVIVENKTGCEFYGAGIIVDTTGDAQVLARGGVPTVDGKNYHTYLTMGADLDSCREAWEGRNIGRLYGYKYRGGCASLYGTKQPEGKPLRAGTTVKDITEYVIENHLECLEHIKGQERTARTIVALPNMPQFREIRRIDGDYTLRAEDAYQHFRDSVAAVCDFDRRDYLYEIPYRTMVRTGFPNLVTAGRTISAQGYAWDVVRVIPPAILTGQAAGIAGAMAVDSGEDIDKIDIGRLQEKLERENVMIHFDDALVPSREQADSAAPAEGHY